ncbi:MAG: TonB-dependent receptor [Prevotellaceae bacterium]|jgi:outer membrane cobalamin receptor|nr:TonB-dependent receptor [Prevotellaceae bacterium]
MSSCLRHIFSSLLIYCCAATIPAAAADDDRRITLSGTVTNARTKEPAPFVSVLLNDGERWTVADEKGLFIIRNVPPGEMTLTITALGYAKRKIKLHAEDSMPPLRIALPEDNLLLEEVVVAAQANHDEIASSYVIDRAGLEHLQMLNVADAMRLLPGGQTNYNQHLATGSGQYLAVRSVSSEDGNPTFGAALEVDGVRLSSNAAFNMTTERRIYGTDTRNIASANVESVEVVTGMPSVQYGDLSNGLVKITTHRGASPLYITASTKPNTKQAALSKGFTLGRKAGVLNASLEHTVSIADLASPYTSYDRNTLSLRYTHTFNTHDGRPLSVEAGITGNMGGYNAQSDPDLFVDTYSKARDNALRAYVKMQWLLDRPGITSIEATASVDYTDKLTEEQTNKSNSSSVAVLHGKEEGYFVATRYEDNPSAPILLIPAGYWYQRRYVDSKPLNTAAGVKAKWLHPLGRLHNQLMAGLDFTGTGNKGRGEYYQDMRYAPTWRDYRFDEAPDMYTVAGYIEEKVQWPIGATTLQGVAGVRWDKTFVAAARYGSVGSLSPRFNLRYTVTDRPDGPLRRLAFTAGWGKAVKLPSFEVLYPRPSYIDRLAFAPGTMADGTTFLAYYIEPYATVYNPDLRWQHSRQWEIGAEAKIHTVSLSMLFFHHRTIDPYRYTNRYTPFTYKFTGQEALENSAIPSADRQYRIDPSTGIITVVDRTGVQPSEVLAYHERRTFKARETIVNGTSFVRRGVEWVVDFGKIPLLQTSVRLDGHYYQYRNADETLTPSSPYLQNMADGNPYKYVGYYIGDAAAANGYETRKANLNITITTHIPAIRMILSLRTEVCLYNFRQNLSEYSRGERGFAVDNRSDNFPSPDPTRYNSDRYVAVYPLYYASRDDMETLIPFAEAFAKAYLNDRPLYNELAKLVERANTDYYFNADRISAYYAMNLSVTKELGNVATLSFSATNFTNNAQQITESDTGLQNSIYNHGKRLIPRFYYSLSLKIKL